MNRKWSIVTVLMTVGCGSTESADRKAAPNNDPVPVVASGLGAMRGVTLDVPRDALRQTYYRATWAVIVGIDRYADAGQWPALAHSAGDAREVHAMLRDELGFAETQIQHLANEQATHDAIFDSIDHWLGAPGRVHADDLVLFYFAGHGKEEDARGYLVAHDAQGEVPGKNYVAVDQLVERLKAIGCRHKCVILDSCYSGALFSANRQEPREGSEVIPDARPTRRAADSLSEYLAEPVFLGLTAGRHRPVGDGTLESGHSPFTATLLDVLRDRADVVRGAGDARWPLGVFSFSSMAMRVLERVGRVAGAENQEPKWGALASTTGNGEILFRPTIERPTTNEKKTHIAYAAMVGEAQAALQSNVDDAEKRLLSCDEPLRGWEWRHLLLCCRMNELADERQRLAGPIAGLAWSSNRQLMACSRPGRLLLRAVDSHATQTPDVRGLFDVQTMLTTADAKHLAVVYGDTLAIIALEGVTRRTTICSDVVSKPVAPLLAISADERLLALCSGKDGLLRMWQIDWAAMKVTPLPAMPMLHAAVDALALAADGKWLAAAAGNKLCVFAAPFTVEPATAEPTTVELNGRARVIGLRMQGDRLAVVDERATVSIRDLTTGQETRVAHPVEPLPLQSVAVSDDLHHVAMALADGRIAIRDALTSDNPSQTTLLPGHGTRITRLAFDAHADRLASGDGSGLVKLWQTSPSAASFAYTGHESAVNALAIGRANLIASGDAAGRVDLWRWQPETNEHRRLHSLRVSGDKSLAHDGEVRAAAFSPTADLLATGGNDGALRLWNTETGALSRELGDGNQPLKCVAFSNDGKYLIAGYSDRNARLWDLSSDATTPCLTFGNAGVGGADARFHTQRLQGIACFDRPSTASGDEVRSFGVFSAAQGVDRLTNGPTAAEWIAWKATDGEVLFRTTSADLTSYGIENHEQRAWATAVAASADSRWLASAGPNRFFTVWHAPTGRLMLQAAPANSSGELYSTGIAFSREGRRLAVATNRALRLWDWQADMHTGNDEAIVLELTDFSAGVSTVVFSPDDQLLAVACGSEVRVFAAAPQPHAGRAAAASGD